jgi:hypothetical protein
MNQGFEERHHFLFHAPLPPLANFKILSDAASENKERFHLKSCYLKFDPFFRESKSENRQNAFPRRPDGLFQRSFPDKKSPAPTPY